MLLHYGLIALLEIEWQEVILEKQLELIDEEVRLRLSLRLGHSKVKVDFLAEGQRLHRHS